MLNGWLQAKEGEHFEFKLAGNGYSFTDLCKYCSALANEGGGKILLGVTNDRPRKAIGSKAFLQPERTRKSLCEHIPLSIDFEEFQHPDCISGRRVLVFEVPSRPVGIPIKAEGRYWMRKEDSLVEMSEARLREIFAESGNDFSAEICPNLNLEDLDLKAIEDFRQRWVIKAKRAENTTLAERLLSLDHSQLLTDAEAMVDGKLNYAALILFGSKGAIGRFLSQAEVVFEYRSTETAGSPQEREEYRQGFLGFYDDLWERINKRNDQQEVQEGLFVTTISTFNERPVREAILNAISHRNYQLSGSVFIRQFPRRLEIDSPGGFPVGIDVDNILDRQNPRNRRIAEILTKCGLVERSGQGMNLIYEDMIKQSKPTPDFSRTDAFHVGLTLFGTPGDPAFIQFVEKILKESSTVGLGTHDWVILSHAAHGEKIPPGQEKRINRLLDAGLIERGKGRTYILGRRYFVLAGKKGEYTRKKGLDREENLGYILKHINAFKDSGSKLEEICQAVPALPRTQVQSLLRSMQRKGTIYSVGKTNQGRWFPGAGPNEAPKVP